MAHRPDSAPTDRHPAPSARPGRRAGRPRVTPRGLYRVVATAEMITWALLILGMLGKYVFHLGDLPVRIGGSIHGFVFLSYCVSTVVVWTDRRWPASQGITGLLLAIVPFATVPFERHADRAGLLSERWRVAAAGTGPVTGAPGEAGSGSAADREPARTAAERLLAVILRWPVLSALVLVVFVAALFTVLLQAGPPTQWFG